ncbi:MAG: hypothetical protein Rpha_0442 [Candidatus Ruthia sp. Apha_13_S6]|nr:hypothetical protein [Candidatus Ruthia sp. Apha_13_S6]
MCFGEWTVSFTEKGKNSQVLAIGFGSAKEAMLWQSKLLNGGIEHG